MLHYVVCTNNHLVHNIDGDKHMPGYNVGDTQLYHCLTIYSSKSPNSRTQSIGSTLANTNQSNLELQSDCLNKPSNDSKFVQGLIMDCAAPFHQCVHRPLGKQRRLYVCACVDKNDEYAYVGTQTGDVVKISLNTSETMDVVKSGSYASMLVLMEHITDENLWKGL
ncbi:hypothetical protein EVAR_72103_1 [Eumeta japonica]|uniref:Uncharacterized protein n=1 Tax=Eumeta variegata TaxID=151549 RepID=A0A4C1SIU0_EUMVA|nr:hypothetical protein EVAR_72103_1 [Eumeta japonica]